MNTTLTKILHIALVVLILVAGLGPTVASLSGVVPATYLVNASHVIATAAALVAYLSQSPLLAPFLPLSSATKTPKLPILPVLSMLACFVVLTLGQGCAWFKANEATLTADGEALAVCIVGEALSGDTSAIAIGVKCGAPAGFDVLGFVGQLLAKLQAPSDAGTVGGAQSSTKADVIAALKAVK